MLSLTLVDTEPEKLASLYLMTILNIQREEGFERITSEAAQLFNAPIALLSFASEYRQWFKTLFGHEPDLSPTAQIQKSKFCTQATNARLIVPDALRDAKFINNPLVTGVPFIRFYAGQPLMSIAGARLGTLCVLDHKPCLPTPEQLATLTQLAARASYELELNRPGSNRLTKPEPTSANY